MPQAATTISGDQALRAAEADAPHIYRDLASYSIHLSLEEDGWHVDYKLKNPKHKGGGPHYVIDAATGSILSKRYEQ